MQTQVSALPVQPININVSRPPTFCERYLAVQSIAYHFEAPNEPSSPGGVLHGGQAVWLEQRIQRTEAPAQVRAFVVNLGFVSVDARWLKKGDGSLSL